MASNIEIVRDYHFGRYYDAMWRRFTDDIQFYKQFIQAHAITDVLECMCGTGRVTAELAALSCNVQAFDNSRGMLIWLKHKYPHLTNIFQGDLINIPVKEKELFDLIIIPFNSLGYLNTSDSVYINTIKALNDRLKPFGFLIIAQGNPKYAGPPFWKDDPFLVENELYEKDLKYRIIAEQKYKKPDECVSRLIFDFNQMHHTFGQFISQQRSAWRQDSGIEFKQELRLPSIQMEYFYQKFTKISYVDILHYEDLHNLCKLYFKSIKVYGNYNREPYSTYSQNMIFVAQKV